jgi:hypothetical protein
MQVPVEFAPSYDNKNDEIIRENLLCIFPVKGGMAGRPAPSNAGSY